MLKLGSKKECQYCQLDYYASDDLFKKTLWRATSPRPRNDYDEAIIRGFVSDNDSGDVDQTLVIEFEFAGFWDFASIEANYCPMCGRKLFKKQEDED